MKEEEILYQFPYTGTDHSSGHGVYWDVKFVMFMDANADEKEDVVIGAEYMTAYENPEPESRNELTCSISNGNEFSGSLFTEQGITERFALVEDITGTIQNGELFYEFTDDGWGETGTLHITFLPNQINVEVLDYQMAEENVIGYGISGSYEMTVRE